MEPPQSHSRVINKLIKPSSWLCVTRLCWFYCFCKWISEILFVLLLMGWLNYLFLLYRILWASIVICKNKIVKVCTDSCRSVQFCQRLSARTLGCLLIPCMLIPCIYMGSHGMSTCPMVDLLPNTVHKGSHRIPSCPMVDLLPTKDLIGCPWWIYCPTRYTGDPMGCLHVP